jgi:hypothetical protein|eukprot:COSAG06_NODE_566_length_14196_cov_2.916578_14_plen_91_part_00
MEGAVDPTWGEAFEVAPLSDEEDVPDPYTDEQVDAAFYDPLSEAALVRPPPIALVVDIFRRGLRATLTSEPAVCHSASTLGWTIWSLSGR